ncbi:MULTISPECIES: glycosyltransferase family 2 protein [Pseudomonas]|jgi:glycosyltransferase involved in cell wall biosynthesis|uniref:glycosyltransferase family 2 protein n=1 Tax=Pseudomonas TaxID=286 RepID=UPI00137A9FDB|nr:MULTISPECIES: glycosyltransferase family 2 protein [Pseudomonas]MDH1621076.1 glycosyltransferase family 2 protein [Pseudomonas chengduensis]
MSGSTAITIVIPAYNYAKTLGRTVRSVVPQLSNDDELLIIDDGSRDHTPQVIEALKAEFPARFIALRKDNGGLASVRNLGIERARHDWLIFLDADDEMAPDSLALIRAHLASNGQTRMVIGGHWSVDQSGRRRQHSPEKLPQTPIQRVKSYLLDKTLSISNGACVMHRSIFRAGNYPERFRNAEDIPVFAQTLAAFPVTLLPEPLALIHKHSDSLRHDFSSSLAGGVELVDEVFRRLPEELQPLRAAFYQQRCLSLFRSACLAGDPVAAKRFYRQAVASDWRVLLKLSYLRKAIRLWMGRLDG